MTTGRTRPGPTRTSWWRSTPRSVPLAPVIAGDYLDRFAKVDGTWRFTERRIGNDLFGDLSDHLLEPIEVASDRSGRSGGRTCR